MKRTAVGSPGLFPRPRPPRSHSVSFSRWSLLSTLCYTRSFSSSFLVAFDRHSHATSSRANSTCIFQTIANRDCVSTLKRKSGKRKKEEKRRKTQSMFFRKRCLALDEDSLHVHTVYTVFQWTTQWTDTRATSSSRFHGGVLFFFLFFRFVDREIERIFPFGKTRISSRQRFFNLRIVSRERKMIVMTRVLQRMTLRIVTNKNL